jgi:hypothetical protein
MTERLEAARCMRENAAMLRRALPRPKPRYPPNCGALPIRSRKTRFGSKNRS